MTFFWKASHTCPHASKALRTLLRTLLRSDARFFFHFTFIGRIPPNSAEFNLMQPNFAEFGRIRMSRPNSAQFRRIRPNQAKPIQFSPIPPNSAEFGRIRPIRLHSTQFRRIRPNQANSGQFSPIPPNSAESSRIRPNQANSTQMDPIQPNSAEQGRIRQFRPNSTQFICGFALTSIIHSNQSLLYTCPIFETSAPALRGTTGNLDLFDYCRRAQTVRSKRPPKCSNNSPSENKKGAYCTLPRFDSTKR